MYFTYNETISWISTHGEELSFLAKSHHIIICPSFITLDHIAKEFNQSHLLLSAQNCSAYKKGAHTGQISAASLAEIGCNYCIIGHSEQRNCDNNDIIEQKVLRLLEYNITPILCISNPQEELTPAITAFHKFPEKEIIIAYEPLNAIGSGNVPENRFIEKTFSTIVNFIEHHVSDKTYYMIYGGSVDSENVKRLKLINRLDGFLIGGASTHFDEFKRIIEF
ncbi:MAG: Triosephosphate isomerase [candidate division TM6 bacterium GW2011_GWE2_36_25]|nr:MAG: Triosephosphate isomerase [candidate division TM6 bacterium GW2011_GWF2_36_131]KKQ03595.1 MAG: Triosephosphate isomerase [candidate division TM6 bacterium GW2011_GWE2_36_25]KKQ20128.1 MAG: Triosephosphate isomerase [candidate division TM6 bacterium GW2011_GWA2_36_9]